MQWENQCICLKVGSEWQAKMQRTPQCMLSSTELLDSCKETPNVLIFAPI